MDFSKEINVIIEALARVSESYFDYEKNKSQALNDYRGLVLDNKIKEEKESLKNRTAAPVKTMEAALEKMIAETGKGNNYDINDASISNAARLLSVSGISTEAVVDVIKGFAGNQTALALLKASANEEYKALFDRWVFDNVGALERLLSLVRSLPEENAENYPSKVSMIRGGVQDFAFHQDIDISSSSEALEEMRIRNIVNLMGLKIEDLDR